MTNRGEDVILSFAPKGGNLALCNNGDITNERERGEWGCPCGSIAGDQVKGPIAKKVTAPERGTYHEAKSNRPEHRHPHTTLGGYKECRNGAARSYGSRRGVAGGEKGPLAYLNCGTRVKMPFHIA